MQHIKHSLINFFRGILFLVRVEGESGLPLLIPGKRYLASGLMKPRIDDFVVFRNPTNPERIFVKKIERILPEGFLVRGMTTWSSSSDDFGIVPRTLVIGKLYGTEYGTKD